MIMSISQMVTTMECSRSHTGFRVAVVGCLAFLLAGGMISASSATGNDNTQNSGLGYLNTPSMSPGHIVHPSSMFLLPNANPDPSLEVFIGLNWANVWNYEPDQYMIDWEWIRSDIRIQYRLTDHITVGIGIPIMERSEGFADSTIGDFHKMAGLSTLQRQFPLNQSTSWFISNGETQTFAHGESWGIGDLAIYAVVDRPGTRSMPSLTMQFQGSLPTGDENEMEGAGAPSFSASGGATKRLGTSPVLAFGGIGLFFCPKDNLASIEMNHLVYSGLFGFEYQYTPSVSFVIQNLSSSAVAKDFYEYDEPCHELSLGAKWKVGEAAILEIAVVENLFVLQNSADIGVHVAFRRTL